MSMDLLEPIYVNGLYFLPFDLQMKIPVVPHKAVAEVSKIGNL